MKTPREVLFSRHQAAGPKLDAIRQSTVWTAAGRGPAADEIPRRRGVTLWQTLWDELYLPSRRIWSSLAAVWLLVLAVNIAQHDRVPAVNVAAAPPTMSLREQQRWINELFADRAPSTEAEPPKTIAPKPRAEIRQSCTV